MYIPFSTQCPSKTGSHAAVAAWTKSLPTTISRGDSTATTGLSSFRLISWANCRRCSSFGLYTFMRSKSKSLERYSMCAPACHPLPNRPSTFGLAGARYFAPSELRAATRIFCMMPSGIMAIGSMRSISNRITNPQYRFPVAAGKIWRRFKPPVKECPDMSDVILSAHTPVPGLPPSCDLKR